jgi:rhodanese-related sulfurtransferase
MTTIISKIDSDTLNNWLINDEAVLVDIREPDEFARERIVGSVLAPLTDFSKTDFNRFQGKKIVFHCAGGHRTQQASPILLSTGFSEVYALNNGMDGWKAAGLSTCKNKKSPISIMRQVQIIVGASMLLGIVSGLLISPWFYCLSAIMSGGLLFAGISGTCAMASLLTYLPYNRPADRQIV